MFKMTVIARKMEEFPWDVPTGEVSWSNGTGVIVASSLVVRL